MDPPRRRGLAHLTTFEQRSAAEPATGWRYWQLRPSGLLRSVTHRRHEWRPGQPLRAVCLIGGHQAPAPGCACGIHASPDVDTLREQGLCLAPGEPLVTGQAALWGVVVTDDHGLRAEYAYPSRLSLVAPGGSDPEASVLAHLSAYGVPVEVVAPEEAVGDVTAAILTFQTMSR